MKASEAIVILEALDPSHEVTLVLNSLAKLKKEPSPVPSFIGRRFEPSVVGEAYLPGQALPEWVIGKEFWPQRNEITCKMH